jgi:hypothetical protein
MKKINKSTNKKNGEMIQIPGHDLAPAKKNQLQVPLPRNKNQIIVQPN